MSDLSKEFDFYIEHRAELAQKYLGKYIVIKNNVVLNAYDDMMTAIMETKKTEELGTFLVQFCSMDDADITCTFHSRVSFAR